MNLKEVRTSTPVTAELLLALQLDRPQLIRTWRQRCNAQETFTSQEVQALLNFVEACTVRRAAEKEQMLAIIQLIDGDESTQVRTRSTRGGEGANSHLSLLIGRLIQLDAEVSDALADLTTDHIPCGPDGEVLDAKAIKAHYRTGTRRKVAAIREIDSPDIERIQEVLGEPE